MLSNVYDKTLKIREIKKNGFIYNLDIFQILQVHNVIINKLLLIKLMAEKIECLKHFYHDDYGV